MLDMTSNPIPFNSGYLQSSDGHSIFYSQFGNPHGQAIISIHGGPGSQSRPKQAKGYDLNKYHFITFDQRGCGKSEPLGEISNNTLTEIIADMEKIRIQLHIDKWFVAGGSWGSTVALAYAQAHSNQVAGLLLSSIWLAREVDSSWAFTQMDGVQKLFPDLWERRQSSFAKFNTPIENWPQVLLQKIQENNSESIEIVANVMNWENNLMTAQEDIHYLSADEVNEKDIAATKIFLHYQANNFFLADNQILNNMDKIQHLPAIIVHGRYDILCPLDAAYAIHKAMPNSQLLVLPTSNHRLTAEGEIARKLAYKLFLNEFA